jgi:hypothetical protein
MPALSFILPHWMYWGGLLLFPLVAMYLVRRQRRRGAPREPTLFTAYLFWLCAGFAGLHRLYLRSWWGFAFLPLIAAVFYCNAVVRDNREDVSRTRADVEEAETQVARLTPDEHATTSEQERAAFAQAQEALRAQRELAQSALSEQQRWLGYSRIVAAALARPCAA